jgi:hypothetical protein
MEEAKSDGDTQRQVERHRRIGDELAMRADYFFRRRYPLYAGRIWQDAKRHYAEADRLEADQVQKGVQR